MPILLILLGLAVLFYLWWERRSSSLGRDCRWRECRREGLWRCAACGAEWRGAGQPRHCLRGPQQ